MCQMAGVVVRNNFIDWIRERREWDGIEKFRDVPYFIHKPLGPFKVNRIVLKQRSVLLHRRPATGGIGDHNVNALVLDKDVVFAELFRVLKPGGRMQIADVTIQTPVSEEGKRNIDLWTG